MVIPVASTVVPLAGQAGKASKISKTKTILKEVAELSETKTDDLVEKLAAKGKEKGIVKKINNFGKYSTFIDDFVTEISKINLPSNVAETFTDGVYRTVITNEKVILYRGFGEPNGYLNGAYSTTIKNATRNELAILDEWKNSLRFEAKIEVPKCTLSKELGHLFLKIKKWFSL